MMKMEAEKDTPRIILVNPWITDFAAYDFWIRPLGLMMVGSWLLDSGWDVRLIDCLDRQHPSVADLKLHSRADGTGRFLKTIIPKPEVLDFVPRYFGRYGIPLDAFRKELSAAGRVDAVFVTSSMTYWYPGVHLAIRTIREELPETPVVLGGRYADLCPEHAALSGADFVYHRNDLQGLRRFLENAVGSDPGIPERGFGYFRPAHELYGENALFGAVLTSTGCPFKCSYCASGLLFDGFRRRTKEDVIAELAFLAEMGVRDIAFYDDALLVNSGNFLEPILEEIIEHKSGFSFHTPNAIHAGLVTGRNAALMKRAGFVKIFTGLESGNDDFLRRTGGKLTRNDAVNAAKELRGAGFGHGSMAAYILAGHPAQDAAMIEDAINFAESLGFEPVLTEFSPVPGTPDFDISRKFFKRDPAIDPLLHNSSIIRFQHPRLGPDIFENLRLKSIAARERVRSG